jgi:hypothetical protein
LSEFCSSTLSKQGYVQLAGECQEAAASLKTDAGMVVSQYDTGPKNLLPKQYADQQETPLSATVRADQNSIDFDLSK